MLASVTTDANVNGLSFRRALTVQTDGLLVKNPTLAAAKTGGLTTRSSNTAGTLTMDAGHGFTTGARLDVYWTKPDGTQGRRYGITAGTVATNSVPISGGAGDNLPAQDTAVTAMVPQLESFAVTASDMNALFVGCGGPATAVFRQSDTTLVYAAAANGPDGSSVWESTDGATTPFGANVADVYLSHGDSTTAWPVAAAAMIN